MPKFFCCSDIHSAYTPWMEALAKAGFDQNNDDHKIILCGDLFDRMDESLQVYEFVKDMLERDKLIYIRGNHEDLMEECIKKGYPESHDYSNGTFKSIVDLAPNALTFDEACTITYAKVKPLFNKTVNYFETKNYIFVHSWIALKCNDNLPAWYTRNRKFEFDPDWRYAHASAWETARWGNPLNLAMDGFCPDKCVVAGHWHCSSGWALKNKTFDDFGPNACFDPFYYEEKLIMIDACTAHSKKVNVLIIEDEFLDETVQNN